MSACCKAYFSTRREITEFKRLSKSAIVDLDSDLKSVKTVSAHGADV